jgi:NTP pyrophosphatase (non-canonical NTP hydrolase)
MLRSQRSLFEGSETPLGLDEFQQFTRDTDKNERHGISGLSFALLGLFGEVGSLLSELKKKQRDKDAYFAYHDSVTEEFGDVLWYFANTALRAGLNLSVVAQRAATSKLDDWHYYGVPNATSFRELQKPQEQLIGPATGEQVEQMLIVLAGTTGKLLEDYGAGRVTTNGDVLSADLIEIFRVLLRAADDAGISLDNAARFNIEKVLSRWPIRRDWGVLYDDEFDVDEQIPRKIVMLFSEKDLYGRKFVIQKCHGINIGDRLTDNRFEADDYRFHDVFHLGYAAILGWSPVVRALFRVKRKSKPEIDESQDGARAILIEEGLSTWIFNHGARHHDFRNVDTLDYGLLKAIQQLVKGYEVESRPLWQ